VQRLLERQFEVKVPLAEAWEFLARIEDWPRWAGHIAWIEVTPQGPLGPDTAGSFHLTNGVRTTFRMVEYVPSRSWKWAGPFLWLTVEYDHVFEEVASDRTRLTWTVDAEGFGLPVFGRLFAALYARSMDRAIARLMLLLESGAATRTT
jgi:hypothetical protein